MDKIKKSNLDLKKEKVTQLSKKIKEAKTIVFADYTKLSAEQMNKLRRKVKEAGGELVIAKNTLLARALKSTDYRLPTTAEDGSQSTVDLLAGPTASLFAYADEIAPVKVVCEVAKTQGAPKFKFGFFGKNLLDAEAVENLSKIPSQEILYSQLVETLASPLNGLAFVLSSNIRNLISILDQKAKIQ